MPPRRLKVLVFAEAVTLAHVARPLALLRSLDPARYELVLACATRYADFASNPAWQTVPLHSIPSAQFAQALAQGAPLYDLATLAGYADADRALIAAHRPDLVVGDFRLSLSVSARLVGVPYLAIVNAYWTPYHAAGFPMPVLPLSRHLPLPLARALFDTFRPLAFAAHCRPLNRLRAQHGLPSLGRDLRRVYSDADHLLVPDSPALFAMQGPAQAFSQTGPLAWSPDLPWPTALDRPVPGEQAVVYLTLGSSGPPQALALTLAALADLPIRVLASTAGAGVPAGLPSNARVAAYLPGDLAASRAQLVICNGGSLAVQQALAAGVPVLGLASNMDQFLNMAPIVAAGAGRLLRTDRLSIGAVRDACQALLQSPDARRAAQRLQALQASAPVPGQVFDQVAQRLTGSARASPSAQC